MIRKKTINAALDKFIMSIFGILPCYNFLWIHHDLVKYSLLLHFSEKNRRPKGKSVCY